MGLCKGYRALAAEHSARPRPAYKPHYSVWTGPGSTKAARNFGPPMRVVRLDSVLKLVGPDQCTLLQLVNYDRANARWTLVGMSKVSSLNGVS